MRQRQFSIVLSDLHLGAGDPLPDGTANPLEDFREDQSLVSMLWHYSRLYYGLSGEFVANGDFFETLMTRSDVRRGGHLKSSEALRRIRSIVAGHPRVFDALAEFSSVPRRRVVFVAGNHDPALHFRAVRRFLRKRIDGSVKFRRQFHRAGNTLVEHGHRFEKAFQLDFNVAFERGEEPRIELPWGAHFVVEYLLPMRRHHPLVDKMITPLWPYFRGSLRERPLHTLAGLCRFGFFYLRNRLSLNRRIRRKFARTFSILRSFNLASNLVPDARDFLRKHPFRALLLGHTHRALITDVVPGRTYINTGTWTKLGRYVDGRITSEKRLTFALVHERRAEPAAELLEWTARGPVVSSRTEIGQAA